MFLTMKSFFTIFFISVLLLSFGTFSEANTDVINFYPTEKIPIIFGNDDTFRMKENIRTGKKQWMDDDPDVSVVVAAWVYGLGIGQGTLENVTILGKNFPMYQDPTKDVGRAWIEKGKGKWDKGSAPTAVGAVFSRKLKDVPEHELKNSYDWNAEGKITLTPKAWEKTVNQTVSLSWPISVRGTYGSSGKWIDQANRSFSRYAASQEEGEEREHNLKLYTYDPLTVLFNKTTFTSDERLKVVVYMENLTSASVKLDGQTSIVESNLIAANTIWIYSDFSDLDFSEANEWYGKVTVTVNYDVDGTTKSANVEQYITVKKVGYSENKTTFSAYGTYEAEVVEGKPIKSVSWYVFMPDDTYELAKYDEVNGGYSSSLSYTFDSDSTSGIYYVHAIVNFGKGKGSKTYKRTIYVDYP